jgi:hypothetical protein
MTITTDNGCFVSPNPIEVNHGLAEWWQRLRLRHDLESLDDFILRDIGFGYWFVYSHRARNTRGRRRQDR